MDSEIRVELVKMATKILFAGVGDPDSGCPQTLEQMKAFFAPCKA